MHNSLFGSSTEKQKNIAFVRNSTNSLLLEKLHKSELLGWNVCNKINKIGAFEKEFNGYWQQLQNLENKHSNNQTMESENQQTFKTHGKQKQKQKQTSKQNDNDNNQNFNSNSIFNSPLNLSLPIPTSQIPNQIKNSTDNTVL